MDLTSIKTIGTVGQGPPDPLGEPRGGPPPTGEFSSTLASQIGDTEATKTQDRTEPQKALKDGRLKQETAKLEGLPPQGTKTPTVTSGVAIQATPSLALGAESLKANGKQSEAAIKPGAGKKSQGQEGPNVVGNNQSAAMVASGMLATTKPPVAPVLNGEKTPIVKRAIDSVGAQSGSTSEMMASLKQSLEDLQMVKQDLKQTLAATRDASQQPHLTQPMVIAIPVPVVMQMPSIEMDVFPIDVEIIETQEDGRIQQSGTGVAYDGKMVGGSSTEDLMNVMAGLAQMKGSQSPWGVAKKEHSEKHDDPHKGSSVEVSSLLQGLLSQRNTAGGGTELSATVASALGKEVQVPQGRVDVNNPWQMAQVVHGLTNQGAGSIRIKLHPEVLGEMTVSLEQTRGAGGKRNLIVNFDASTAEARAALTNNMGELRNALKAKDSKLGALDIQVTGDQMASASWLGSLDGSNVMGMKNLNGSNTQGQSQGQSQGHPQGQYQQGQHGSLGDDRGRGHADNLWERFYGQGGHGSQGDSGTQKRYNPRWHYAGAEL